MDKNPNKQPVYPEAGWRVWPKEGSSSGSQTLTLRHRPDVADEVANTNPRTQSQRHPHFRPPLPPRPAFLAERHWPGVESVPEHGRIWLFRWLDQVEDGLPDEP